MPMNRAAWRNVHFYEASTGEMLGGTYQNGSMTQANFLAILDKILLVVEDHWSVRHRSSGQTTGPTNNPIRLGEYDIYSNGRIRMSDEPLVARVISHSISGREDSFRDGVRARDGKCVVSGAVNIRAAWNIWSGFEACHVFPLEKKKTSGLKTITAIGLQSGRVEDPLSPKRIVDASRLAH
ncbi:hypothetical protein VTN77DRAFT_6906 [Rasamsonia byssochlamydoides]|uniref:uncharacterized protein n=1 Tax=Rasamsonia byssochlamydoides TaxID=89139 RepID=UPI003743FCF0